jgi:hypothetical protein
VKIAIGWRLKNCRHRIVIAATTYERSSMVSV